MPTFLSKLTSLSEFLSISSISCRCFCNIFCFSLIAATVSKGKQSISEVSKRTLHLFRRTNLPSFMFHYLFISFFSYSAARETGSSRVTKSLHSRHRTFFVVKLLCNSVMIKFWLRTLYNIVYDRIDT